VDRTREERVGLADLDDPAEIHHGDAVGDVPHDCKIMRDEQVGQMQFALQVLQQVDDLRLHRNVERGDRLVADDEGRPQRERACDPDALPLAAGEFVRVTPHRRARQPHQVDRFQRAAPTLRARSDPVDRERLHDGLGDGEPRIERSERVLEHDLHAAAHRPHLALRERRDVDPFEPHRSGARLDQSQQQAAGGRLAAARFADQTERLAARDREIDAVDRTGRRLVAQPSAAREVLGQARRFDQRAHAARSGRR
jgi:hypothetical protein